MTLNQKDISSKIIKSAFNVYNILAATSVGLLL
jgi:UDP-N-acetylmuramyl tripeptide synthase